MEKQFCWYGNQGHLVKEHMKAIWWLIFYRKCFIFSLRNLPKIKHVTNNKSLFDSLKIANVTKDRQMRVDIARLFQIEENVEIVFLRSKEKIS